MKNELDEIKEKIIDIRRETFIEGFSTFKGFNKFDDFVENCLKNGIEQLLNNEIFFIECFKKFDLNKTLLENYKKVISDKMYPQDVKLNMAKMFAYNLDNEIVKGTIRCDAFCFETIKKELVESELFEQIEKLNNIKNK